MPSGRRAPCLPLIIVSLVAILLPSCLAADNAAFSDYKIAALGETGVLQCNDTDSLQAVDIPDGYTPVSWMLPNLSRVDESKDRHELTEDNYTLSVFNTTIEDLGVYHCMLLNASQWGDYYLVKVGLNAEGPYFFDMWEKYMWPTIIGICTFFGFLILAAIAVVLYLFRYIPPEEHDHDDETEEEEEGRSVEKEKVSELGHGIEVEEVKNAVIATTLVAAGSQNHYDNPMFLVDDHHSAGHHGKEVDSDEDLTAL